MATAAEIDDVIRTRFDANFSSYPVTYDNAKTIGSAHSSGAELSLTVQHGETRQADIAGGEAARERTPGVAIASIFWPLGKGDGGAMDLAETIRTAFKRVTVSGVTFRTPWIQKVGPRGDSFQLNVMIPYYSDEV